MKTIKIAMIGTGYIADYHANGILSIPGAEIVAVVSRQLDHAQAFAAKYGIPAAFDTIDPVTGDPSIDAAVIATPNFLHAPYAIAFLQADKDVFLEKPMAMDGREGKMLSNVAQDTGRHVMVGHMWRFDVEARYVRDVILSGKLGKIIKTKGYGSQENWGPVGWFTRRQQAGGGALADMGLHAIDTARYLLGDPRPVKVYARVANHFGDYDVDDTAILLITWDNGSESIVESGWWHPHTDGPEASTGVYGTRGFAQLFPTYLKIENDGSIDRIEPEFQSREEHCDQAIYTAQMEYFIACVRNNTVPVPGIHEGQVVVDIVDAAYTSSKLGRAIDL